MTDEQTTQNSGSTNDETSAGRTTSSKRPPRELPRRGYDDQPRPMNPPPPMPLTTEQPRQRPVSRLSDQPRRTPPPPPSVPPATTRRGQRPRPSKRDSGLYLPWWSLLILILIAGAASFGLLAFVLSVGGDPLGDQPAQVVITTNEFEPTLQPVFNTTSGELPSNAIIITVTPGGVPTGEIVAPTQVPLADPTETLLPGVGSGCPVNVLVVVVGTGVDGLLLRSEPRQADNVVARALDGEQYRIVSGPETSTGVGGDVIEWCEIEGVDADRSGWAARQFLAEITVE